MDGNLLKAKIIERGFTTADFIEDLNKNGTKMNRGTFYKKRKGNSDFTRQEIIGIGKVLNLSDKEMLRIFFAQSVS